MQGDIVNTRAPNRDNTYVDMYCTLSVFPFSGDKHASPEFFRGLQALCKKVSDNNNYDKPCIK